MSLSAHLQAAQTDFDLFARRRQRGPLPGPAQGAALAIALGRMAQKRNALR